MSQDRNPHEAVDKAQDGSPIAGLRALADTPPPAALVARVMTEVQQPATPGFWSLLRRPLRIQFWLSPLGLLGAAGLLGATVWMGMQPIASMPAATQGSTVAQPLPALTPAANPHVLVRLTLAAADAAHVSVVGDFNGWDPDQTPLQRQGDRFEITLPLAAGKSYHYQFVVDDTWQVDPDAEHQPDGFGSVNSVIRL